MRNKSVLVSAYTSNALDNILLGYKKYSTDFVRIGTGGKLNEEALKQYSTNSLRSNLETVDELRRLYDNKVKLVFYNPNVKCTSERKVNLKL